MLRGLALPLAGLLVCASPAMGAQQPGATPSGMEPARCLDLGVRHRHRDDVLAASFYQCACAGGLATGCHELARMYRAGEGVARDDAKADSLYRRAKALEEMQGGERSASKDPDLDAAREGADLSRKVPGFQAWRDKLDLFNAEAEACVPVRYSGTYYVRVRADGSIGAVLARPRGEIGRCIELAVARQHVARPPGGGDAWVTFGLTIAK